MRSRPPRRGIPSRRRMTRHAHPEMGSLPPRSRLWRLRGVQPDGVSAAERRGRHEDGRLRQRQTGVRGRGPAGLGVIAARGGRRSRTAARGRHADLGTGLRRRGPCRSQCEGAAGRRRIGRWQGQLRHDRSIGGLHPPRAAARVELHPGRRVSGIRRYDVGAGAGPGARIRRPHRTGGPRPRASVPAAQLQDASRPHAVQLVPRRRDRRVPDDGQATGAGCR